MTIGKWVPKAELKDVKRARIITETNPEPSRFLNDDGTPKTQDVCKVQFEGMPEAYKVGLSQIVINALIEAFGEDSKDWMGKTLNVETEKTRVAGKAGIALYLIPDGFMKSDNDEGYAQITKVGGRTEETPEEETRPDIDLPF